MPQGVGVQLPSSVPVFWRDGRVVDSTGLENRSAERHRGFKSLSLSARIYEDVGSKVRLLELSDLQHPDGQKTRMFSWFV